MTSETVDEIAVPDRPDVPGLRFRHFRGDADYAGMAAANQAGRDAAGSHEVITAESMARDYAHLVNSVPEHDILIVERDGEIIGYARTEWRDQTDGTRAYFAICNLHPQDRGLGIRDAMLAWSEARLQTVASQVPADRVSIMRTFNSDSDTEATALCEQRGWTREGRGYEMVRPTLDDIPDLPLPDGFEVRPVNDIVEERRVWEAEVEAFRDHRAEIEWAEEDWASVQEDPNRDRTLWAIAYEGDEIASGVEGRIDPVENAHHGLLQGYVDGVWTRKPFRRRGLARALLARVLVAFSERGMTSAYLGVDGLNPNQAVDLYTSLGFEIRTSETDWTKPLPGDAPAAEEAP